MVGPQRLQMVGFKVCPRRLQLVGFKVCPQRLQLVGFKVCPQRLQLVGFKVCPYRLQMVGFKVCLQRLQEKLLAVQIKNAEPTQDHKELPTSFIAIQPFNYFNLICIYNLKNKKKTFWMFYELYNLQTKFQNTSIQKLLIVYIRQHRTLLQHIKEPKASFTATPTHLNCYSILICIFKLKYKISKYNRFLTFEATT